jgi:hypothetical protein
MKDVNIDEGKILFEDEPNSVPHINRVLDAAQQGHWVMICPLAFP